MNSYACVHIHVFVCIYIYTYIYTCIYLHTFTYIFTYIYIYLHIYLLTRSQELHRRELDAARVAGLATRETGALAEELEDLGDVKARLRALREGSGRWESRGAHTKHAPHSFAVG